MHMQLANSILTTGAKEDMTRFAFAVNADGKLGIESIIHLDGFTIFELEELMDILWLITRHDWIICWQPNHSILLTPVGWISTW